MKHTFCICRRHGRMALVAAFLLLNSLVTLHGQVRLSGIVTDGETKQPLPGAHIRLNNNYRNAVSTADGMFSIPSLPRGSYSIKVSYVGFGTSELVIELNRDTTLAVELHGSALLGEEVNITATRAQEKYPTAFSSVNSQEIRKLNLGKDVPYLVLQTPSVVVTSDAGNGIGYTGLSVRGTDLTRINVTVNSIPLNDAESQGVWFVDLPDIASSTADIQVQRGVGTSTNGAGAFGASINFMTSDLHQDPHGELQFSGGSFNTFRTALKFGTGLMSGKFSVDGRLSYIRSDGYIDRAASRLRSYYLAGGYYGKKSTIRLITFSGYERTYQAWEGVPGDSLATNRTFNPAGMYYDSAGNIRYYQDQVDNYQQDHYQFLYSQKLGDNWNVNAALHYTKGRGYYENYKMDQPFSDYGLSNVILGTDTITETDLVNRKMMDNDFFGITFSANYTLPDKLKLSAGGAWNQYYGEHSGKVIWATYASNGDNDRNWYYNTGLKKDFNLYVKAGYQLIKKLNIFADLQYRRVSYEMEGTLDNQRQLAQNNIYNFFNPKAGLYFTFSPSHEAYLSFGTANREPSRNNFKDADPGQVPVPERLYDYELGYTFRLPWSTFGANLYYMDYKNQIVLTGKINNVGEAIMVNVPESYRAGIELTANVDLFRKVLNWQVSATFSQNRIRDFVQYIDEYDADWNFTGQKQIDLGTTNLSFSPGILASSLVTVKPAKGLLLMLSSRYVGKQYIDNTSNDGRSLNDYLVHGAGISYTIAMKPFKEIVLNLQASNLFSKKYESNAWVYPWLQDNTYYEVNGYFPQATLNFLGGITFRL